MEDAFSVHPLASVHHLQCTFPPYLHLLLVPRLSLRLTYAYSPGFAGSQPRACLLHFSTGTHLHLQTVLSLLLTLISSAVPVV